MKVIFNLADLKAAADFLAENHKGLRYNVDEWENEIRRLIVKGVNSGDWFVSTAGITIIFDYINDNCIAADITVSPSFNDFGFVNAEIVNDKLVVII